MIKIEKAQVIAIKERTKKIVDSNIVLSIFLLLIIIVFSLALTLYINGNLTIKTPWVGDITSDSEYSGLGYFQITLSLVANLMVFIGYVLSIRKDKRYIYFSVPGSFLFIINAIILGGVFTGIANFGIAIVSILSYKNFKKETEHHESHDTHSLMTKKMWIWSAVFLIVYIAIFLPISYIFVYDDLSQTSNIICGLIDVVASGMLIVAWYVVLKKSKWGLVIFLIADFFYIIFFVIAGDYISVSNYLAFIIFECIAFVYWYFEEKELKINSDENSKEKVEEKK